MSLHENIPSPYNQLLESEVAVFGYGASGKSVIDLLRKLGVPFTSYEERTGEEESVQRKFDMTSAVKHRLVIHSPAFRTNHKWIELARECGCHIVSEIEFAQKLRTGPTIVVTGTNGKTTLQEFITFSLKRIGISAVATGQNSYPLSRLAVHPELDGVTAVCEMGPAYIEPLGSFRYDALFWINFHEDHLESEEERRQAFEGFRRLTTLCPEGMVYVGPSVVEEGGHLGCSLPDNFHTLAENTLPDWDLPSTSAFATTIHRPALALFRQYWLQCGYSDSLLKGAAEHFEVRVNRLHVSASIGEVNFWNDANAHNFAATRAALGNFSIPVVWIGGGHYRGGNLQQFVDSIEPSLKGAVLIGNAAWQLLPILEDRGIPCRGALNLRQAVETAFSMTENRAPVVYSPGFIPGDLYDDLIERGICFENAVLGLKHHKGSV